MVRAEVTIAGDRRCFGSRGGKMFLSLSTSFLPHFLHYSLSISISQSSSISISHLSQVFLLPSMVIQSPWKPWATEQQEATVGFLCLVRYLSFCLPVSTQSFNTELKLCVETHLLSSVFNAKKSLPLNCLAPLLPCGLAYPSLHLSLIYLRDFVTLLVLRYSCSWVAGTLEVPPLMLSAKLPNISKLCASIFATDEDKNAQLV